MKIRYKCPQGHVFNGDENTKICQECGQPLAFMKAHFGAMGFKIVVEPAKPEEMPPV